MYVNLGLFFRALSIALFRRRFSIKRWAIVALFCVLFWTAWTVAAIGRALDFVLFPGFRRQRVDAPVFIIAPPRSGTSYLQKVMCRDEDRFASVKLYETVFASVIWLRLFDLIGAIDRVVGAPLGRLLRWSERKWFGGWDDMHRMSFTAPEEDECFFVYTCMAEALMLLFPYPQELEIATRADRLPAASRRRLMRHYRGCLQRFLYARGRDKILLSKNPGHAGRIHSLLEEFPDARVISIIRHPHESLPSHVSIFYVAWQVHSPEIPKVSPETEAYAEIAVDWYRNMLEHSRAADPTQYVAVRYEDLISDPGSTVRGIYAHFGWEPSEAFAASLDEATGRQRGYESKHRYSLEEYGLSEDWIEERLGDVLDTYALR